MAIDLLEFEGAHFLVAFGLIHVAGKKYKRISCYIIKIVKGINV